MRFLKGSTTPIVASASKDQQLHITDTELNFITSEKCKYAYACMDTLASGVVVTADVQQGLAVLKYDFEH